MDRYSGLTRAAVLGLLFVLPQAMAKDQPEYVRVLGVILNRVSAHWSYADLQPMLPGPYRFEERYVGALAQGKVLGQWKTCKDAKAEPVPGRDDALSFVGDCDFEHGKAKLKIVYGVGFDGEPTVAELSVEMPPGVAPVRPPSPDPARPWQMERMKVIFRQELDNGEVNYEYREAWAPEPVGEHFAKFMAIPKDDDKIPAMMSELDLELAEYPNSVLATTWKAVLLRVDGKCEQSLSMIDEYFRRVPETEQLSPTIELERAKCLVEKGRWADADKLLHNYEFLMREPENRKQDYDSLVAKVKAGQTAARPASK